MKKRLYSTLIILFVFINSSLLVFADNSNVTVHVTQLDQSTIEKIVLIYQVILR